MLGIYVDLENELIEIEREVDMLARGGELYEQHTQDGDDSAFRWLAIQGLASGAEKIYTGCERVMAKIASDIDGARIDHGEGWHASLLRRMANPFPGIRGAVISEESLKGLDQLRAFRHRERNTYGLSLDPEIVTERAVETEAIFARFRTEISAFIKKMNDPKPDGGCQA